MSYPIINSKINSSTLDFKDNFEDLERLTNEIKNRIAKNSLGGGTKLIEKHKSKGKLFVLDRINFLIDRDSFFLEL